MIWENAQERINSRPLHPELQLLGTSKEAERSFTELDRVVERVLQGLKGRSMP